MALEVFQQWVVAQSCDGLLNSFSLMTIQRGSPFNIEECLGVSCNSTPFASPSSWISCEILSVEWCFYSHNFSHHRIPPTNSPEAPPSPSPVDLSLPRGVVAMSQRTIANLNDDIDPNFTRIPGATRRRENGHAFQFTTVDDTRKPAMLFLQATAIPSQSVPTFHHPSIAVAVNTTRPVQVDMSSRRVN